MGLDYGLLPITRMDTSTLSYLMGLDYGLLPITRMDTSTMSWRWMTGYGVHVTVSGTGRSVVTVTQ